MLLIFKATNLAYQNRNSLSQTIEVIVHVNCILITYQYINTTTTSKLFSWFKGLIRPRHPQCDHILLHFNLKALNIKDKSTTFLLKLYTNF